MGKPAPKPTVIVSGNTLTFAQAGIYTIDYLPSGNVKIKVNGQEAVVLKPAEYAAISSFNFANGATLNGPIHVNGVTFHEADAGGPFEINYNLNVLIGSMITAHGIDYTVDNLVINGSRGDTLMVLWDYLDDAYVAGGNPFNVALNETFVRLGLAYVDYIENGGTPFTDVVAKFTADSAGDADLIPERLQSMHDNFLGNLTIGAIDARFSGDPVLKAALLALIPDEYEARLLYEGNDTQVGGARHDNVRAFDYDHGWDRPDYLDSDMNGTIDPLARDGGEMFYGDGNTIGDWNLVRHEGAQVELGLKVKHRGGSEYAEAFVDGAGIAHYNVNSGSQIGNPARAEWNFDFAATDFSPDSNFKYVVELDFDPGAGTQWVTLYSSDNPLDTALGGGDTFQNSSNVAFYAAFMDTDSGTPGIQPYAFGTGEFDLRVSAFDAATNLFVVSHEVTIHVI